MSYISSTLQYIILEHKSLFEDVQLELSPNESLATKL